MYSKNRNKRIQRGHLLKPNRDRLASPTFSRKTSSTSAATSQPTTTTWTLSKTTLQLARQNSLFLSAASRNIHPKNRAGIDCKKSQNQKIPARPNQLSPITRPNKLLAKASGISRRWSTLARTHRSRARATSRSPRSLAPPSLALFNYSRARITWGSIPRLSSLCPPEAA